MNTDTTTPTPQPNASPAPPERAPTPERTLRRLFMTLFLRGRTSRGLKKNKAPTSVGKKLFWSLLLYVLLGLLAIIMRGQSVFILSAYLHAMTFMFAGMFIATSAGEILFNREEADILLHRPVRAKSLLWAKVRVLIEVSLYLAVAFNLVGFVVGSMSPHSSWLFVPVHFFSLVLETTFTCGCVVLAYQLCLRWFGRERLEGLMTMAQIVVSLAAVFGGQIIPQLLIHDRHVVGLNELSIYIVLLPPAWFAGIDDVLAGEAATVSWYAAALAALATPLVLWLAFGKLANDYEAGLQMLNESVSMPKRQRTTRRLLDRIVDLPPFSWWLRDPVARASFLLTAAYMLRDRETKLRIYPGIAPMMAMPIMFLIPSLTGRGGSNQFGGFGVAFAAGYLGIIPLLAVSMLQFSQNWQAADIFRMAPLPGPGRICSGSRGAAMLFLTLPVLLFLAIVAVAMKGDLSDLQLLLPGAIALPIFALVPNLGGKGVPLSLPGEEAKSAGRGLVMICVMPLTLIISGAGVLAKIAGFYWWFILMEIITMAIVYYVMRHFIDAARWPSLE